MGTVLTVGIIAAVIVVVLCVVGGFIQSSNDAGVQRGYMSEEQRIEVQERLQKVSNPKS